MGGSHLPSLVGLRWVAVTVLSGVFPQERASLPAHTRYAYTRGATSAYTIRIHPGGHGELLRKRASGGRGGLGAGLQGQQPAGPG